MAKNIDEEILKELMFSTVRPNVSVEANKENYFVFEIENPSKNFGSTLAYETFGDFYENSRRAIRFKRKRKLKKQLKLIANTIVKSDNVEYTLTDKKGKEKIVVLVKVIDTNPEYSKKAGAPKPKDGIDLPVINNSYYIEKKCLHPIDPEKTDPPQTKIVIDPVRGKKKKSKDWFKKPDDTILETDDTIYVVKQTTKNSWKDHEEQTKVFEETKSTAVDFFISHYKINLSRKKHILEKAQDEGRYVANRPKAKCKMLISIPRQALTVPDIPPPAEIPVSYVLDGLTLGDLKKHIQVSYKYLKTIAPLVKKENIALDLEKESSNFASVAFTVISFLKSNKTYPAKDEEKIRIGFGEDGYKIAKIEVFPKEVESASFPMGAPFSQEDLDELSKPFEIKFNRAFTTNKAFRNVRSMLYFMNVDLMSQQIQSSNVQTSKWYDFLVKYTHKMPEYKPAATATQTKLVNSQKVKSEIETLQSNFMDGMTHSAKEAALSAIGPALKSSIGDIQRSMFEKIEDPTIKMIFQNIEQINSIESLYELVLDKIPTEKLLRMADEAISSKIPKQNFLEDATDSPNNIPSLDFSSNTIINPLLDKLPSTEGLSSKFLGISEKLKDGFSFDFSSGKSKIFDVTEGKTEETYAMIREVISSSVTGIIKTLLKTIKDGLNIETDEEKNKKIGSFDIQSSITPDQFTAAKLALNSLSDTFFEDHDIANIFKIISDLATPLEILAIFEGRGDSEVIDIIGTEIIEQYPFLSATLVTIYDKEDFLMLIGKNILDAITTQIGNQEIEENKNKKLEIDFCDPVSADNIIDHLIGRFPEEFLEEQKTVREEKKNEIKSLIDGIEKAINAGSLEDFLFGSKIKDLLNSIAEESKSSNTMIDMVVKGYFEPIESIYGLEALQAGETFISQNVTPDNNDNIPLDQGIQIEINRLRSQNSDSAKQKATELEDKAKAGKKKIILDLGETTKELKTNLETLPCSFNFEDNSYTIGKSNTKIEVKYSNFEQTGINPVKGSSDIQYKDVDIPADTPNFAKYSIKGFLDGTIAIDSERDIELDTTTMWKKGYLEIDDYNIPPRKAGFVSYIKEVFEDLEHKSSTEDIQKSLDDIKNYIFDWSSEVLINSLAMQASQSPFFQIPNLKKLKFATTQNDERVPPLACDEENTEEGSKSQTNQDQLIEEIILLEDIEERFQERKAFFSTLEKERNEKIFNRSAIENAILMETTETFFKVLALEFLISGIFVFSEVSVKTLLDDKNNFKMMQDMMFFTMEKLGNNFKNNFSLYLTQYIEIKKELYDEEAPTGPENFDQKLDELVDIKPNDLRAIVNFIFKEQVFNIYEAYQKAIRLVSNKAQLEVNEFLDVIPNIDIAWSSMSPPENNRYRTNPALNQVKKRGGFVLEKYIRADYAPTKQVAALTDFVVNRQSIVKIASFGLDGELMWTLGGDDQGIDNNLINAFFHQQSSAIHAAASNYKADPAYQLYVEKTPLFGGQEYSYKVKSVDKIFDILTSHYEAQGDEFLQTLPGYQEIMKSLKDINYTTEGENVAFAYPNYDGAVNLNAFIEMQDFIKNDINKGLEDTLQTSVDTYEGLAKASAALQTYEAELADLKILWVARYDIVKNALDSYAKKFAEPIEFTLPNPGGMPDPFPFSDKEIFNWTKKAEEIKKNIPAEDQYIAIAGEIIKLITEDIDVITSRMEIYRDNLTTQLEKNEYNTLFKVGYIGLTSEEIDNIKDKINKLHERITELTKVSSIEAFDNLKHDTEEIAETEAQIENVLEGYVYETDIKEFFISEIKAAEEAQQKALADYNATAVIGPYTQYFKSLKYGLRLSYVYPGADGSPDVSLLLSGLKSSELDKILTNIDKTTGKPADNKNEKTFQIKEIFEDTSVGGYLDNALNNANEPMSSIKIYSIPLVEVEEEINNYFVDPPPNPGPADDDRGDTPNANIRLLEPEIASKFPLSSLKAQMIKNETYKMLMSEMYNYGDIATILGLYSSLYTFKSLFEGASLGVFSGTKLALRDVFQSANESRDFSYIDTGEATSDLMKNNIVNIANPAGNPSKEEGVKEESFGYAAAFAKQTGITILKYFVETTDPAIIRGKQIQKAIVGAIKAGSEAAAGVAELAGAEDADVDSGLSTATEGAANEGLLLPIVMFGVRPFPPIPFPFGDPTAPLTPAGATYLALTAAGGLDSVMSSGETSQDVVKQENPDKNCDDK